MYFTIFVYGTLKKQKGNNHLLNNSEFLGEGYTKGALFVSGLPYLRPGDDNVLGEVYKVTKDTLMRLDALEGHPSWYKRTPCKVDLKTSQESPITKPSIDAEAYFFQRELDKKYYVPQGVF